MLRPNVNVSQYAYARTSFTYDLNGNRLTQAVTRTFNGSPQTLTTSFTYDNQNRLTKTCTC